MSDDQQFRYNCLELAHRLMSGKTDITGQAQVFHDFVIGGNGKPVDGYVMVDRAFAERIASERDDVDYDPKAAKMTLRSKQPGQVVPVKERELIPA